MCEPDDMEIAETPAPTAYNNQGNENEDDIHINIDSESYKLTMYIEFTSLVIMLEPGDNNPDKILQNSFNIAELKSLHKSLKVSENLEDAKTTLLEIFSEKKPTIQKIENGVTLTINYMKNKPVDYKVEYKNLTKDELDAYTSYIDRLINRWFN